VTPNAGKDLAQFKRASGTSDSQRLGRKARRPYSTPLSFTGRTPGHYFKHAEFTIHVGRFITPTHETRDFVPLGARNSENVRAEPLLLRDTASMTMRSLIEPPMTSNHAAIIM